MRIDNFAHELVLQLLRNLSVALVLTDIEATFWFSRVNIGKRLRYCGLL